MNDPINNLISAERERRLAMIAAAMQIAIASLASGRQRHVIRARYGFRRAPATLAEVAAELGVSVSRAWRIERAALRNLQKIGWLKALAADTS